MQKQRCFLAIVLSGIFALVAALPVAAADPASCSFSKGITTCVSTSHTTETVQIQLISGCVAGPTGQPGRLTRTIEQTFLVTVTTTTLSHGAEGRVYSSSTDVTRELVSAEEISRVCEPI
jgi:hypothetical protein